MSIGIGVRYEGGFVVCADSKVVLEDGSTKIGAKLVTSQSWATITIANASTNDGNAGTALAHELLNDLADLNGGGPPAFEAAIKARMKAWYAGYGSPGARPPDMKFVIAMVAIGYRGLYFCEPPQTVIRSYVDAVVIGAGAAVVDPLIPTILHTVFPLRSTLLRLGYLMYRAKKDQALVGGPTDLVVMPFGFPLPPGPTWADRDEMETLEVLGEFVDDIARECVFGLLSGESRDKHEAFLINFNQLFMEKSEMFSKIQFPSLSDVGL